MRSDKFGSGILLSFIYTFPELNGKNSGLTAFTSKIQVFCRPEWTEEGDPMKMNFDIFQIQKWILQTVRAQKRDEKMGSSV